jgi:hypothetical protein
VQEIAQTVNLGQRLKGALATWETVRQHEGQWGLGVLLLGVLPLMVL